MHVKEFHKKVLGCCDLVTEEVLIDVCLHGMMEEYRIFLESLFLFQGYWKLQCTDELVRKTSRYSSIIPSSLVKSTPKERPNCIH